VLTYLHSCRAESACWHFGQPKLLRGGLPCDQDLAELNIRDLGAVLAGRSTLRPYLAATNFSHIND
jgi:hypothetical protein